MNWDLLQRGLPIAIKVLREVFDAIRDDVDNDEIRRRVASPDVILDDELNELKKSKSDLNDYIKNG